MRGEDGRNDGYLKIVSGVKKDGSSGKEILRAKESQYISGEMLNNYIEMLQLILYIFIYLYI